MRLLLAISLLLLVLAYRSFGGPLDGTAWEVRMRKDSFFALPRKDTLAFDRGKLTSAGSLDDGFSPGGYSATAEEGGDAAWQARLDAPDGRMLDWSGTVEGDHIEGRMTLRKGEDRPKDYVFRGTRR
ncbi:MAG: hypothetical protein WCU88_07760 [Elusimicrobiota bacterium]|jgi:hypothetical protein